MINCVDHGELLWEDPSMSDSSAERPLMILPGKEEKLGDSIWQQLDDEVDQVKKVPYHNY